jgi:hypothetical protein
MDVTEKPEEKLFHKGLICTQEEEIELRLITFPFKTIPECLKIE